ncbi:MAG: hypothetical protein COV66_07080 [Nitrospinae bacterium CG11_big_fil_rev_8_21_14_0_20_45_15]|nr:MAG: hypothetical protein COV66_07080 [Nitrospinae bacterium CG11_big_fil_rev_8_21_14_0_20_45_15]
MKSVLVFLIGLIALIGLMSCDEPSLQKKSPAGKELWIVATDTTLIPMSFVNDKNAYDGFEIELIEKIAERAGANIEIVSVEWPGLFGGLLTGKFDMVISSVTILEERQQKMAFSIPYLTSGLALVVRKDRNDIHSMADVRAKQLQVGAQTGTTAFFYLEKQNGLRIKGYQVYGHAITDLINGELDAVLGESSATLYIKNQKEDYFKKIKMVGEIMTEENYGIVLRKEDTARLEKINTLLDGLLRDGTVSRLHEKWELGASSKVPPASGIQK